MKKSTQFISASILAVIGMIFVAANRFSASADAILSYHQQFTIILIMGLVLMAVAAFWFFRLSKKD